jgi:hypothetical protein
MATDIDGYEKIKYAGKNLEEDVGICNRTRNVENKNQSRIAGSVWRFGHCSRHYRENLGIDETCSKTGPWKTSFRANWREGEEWEDQK